MLMGSMSVDLMGSLWPCFPLTDALELLPLSCEKGAFLSFAHYLEGPEKTDISCQMRGCKERQYLKG